MADFTFICRNQFEMTSIGADLRHYISGGRGAMDISASAELVLHETGLMLSPKTTIFGELGTPGKQLTSIKGFGTDDGDQIELINVINENFPDLLEFDLPAGGVDVMPPMVFPIITAGILKSILIPKNNRNEPVAHRYPSALIKGITFYEEDGHIVILIEIAVNMWFKPQSAYMVMDDNWASSKTWEVPMLFTPPATSVGAAMIFADIAKEQYDSLIEQESE